MYKYIPFFAIEARDLKCGTYTPYPICRKYLIEYVISKIYAEYIYVHLKCGKLVKTVSSPVLELEIENFACKLLLLLDYLKKKLYVPSDYIVFCTNSDITPLVLETLNLEYILLNRTRVKKYTDYI